MNKLTKTMLTIIGLAALGFIVLKTPLPMTQEQIEFDEAIFTAQRLRANGKCENAMEILDALQEEFPSTSIYIELEREGCYKGLKQYDKLYDSCMNSKLTEYMPARAALCSKQLASAGKFDEALAIWDKNIQDRPEEIFPYSNISPYEQWRTKTNMKIQKFISSIIHPGELTQDIKNQSLANIQALKEAKSKKK